MKNEIDQKIVKNSLNEALSATVKLLQTEAKREGDSVILADSESVQHFVLVLEAAFVHGLKIQYYEKQKYPNAFPKPQFWNLIRKLSHKDTIDQIRKLNYVRTNVGRCRAWLRLALNELALSSYLAALLQSSEYSELLLQYYDAHALFRDSEQRDIFLTYLQGAENLTFELVCNSAILDTWTKTPLELSGIIPSNVGRKQMASNVTGTLHLPAVSPSMIHARSFDSLNSFNSKDESFAATVKNALESSASQPSASSPDKPSLPLIEVENVETIEEAKELATTGEDGKAEIPDLSAVLYERHLNPRRKAKHKHEDGRLTPQSRCSSASSINNSELDESLELTTSQESVRSRRSCADSRRDVSSSAINVDSRSVSPLSSEVPMAAADLSPSEASHNAPNLLGINRAPSPRSEKDRTSLAGSDVASDSSFESSSNQLQLDVTDSKFAAEIASDSSSSQSENDDKSTNAPTHERNSSETSSSHEDIDDIYSDYLSRSRADTDILSKTGSSTIHSSTSGSPGYGNSLLCGLGWSSEIDEESLGPQPPVIRTQPPTLNDSYHSQTSEESELVIREGMLQTKSFRFWRARWFVLTTTALLFYKAQNRQEELGVIHLVDVDTIEDKNIKKKKILSLQMLNGDSHQVGATSSRSLASWAEDISHAVKNVKNHSVNLNSIETTYVVLESTDIDSEIEHKSASEQSNTSWRSTMRSHITRIATEKGLDTQNYQCTDCAAPIGILYGEPRVCYFTGQYYCPQCHLNEEYQIPARMIHNWDFKKHKVSKRSKSFLTSIWKEPCIDLNRVNPVAYRYLEELRKLLPLRIKLSAVYPYVSTCRVISTKELVSM